MCVSVSVVLSIFVIATDPLLSTNSGTEATWGQDEHTGISSAPGIPSNEQVSSCIFIHIYHDNQYFNNMTFVFEIFIKVYSLFKAFWK